MKVFFCIKKTKRFELVPKVQRLGFGGLSSKIVKVGISYRPWLTLSPEFLQPQNFAVFRLDIAIIAVYQTYLINILCLCTSPQMAQLFHFDALRCAHVNHKLQAKKAIRINT